MPFDIGFVLTGENPEYRFRSKHALDLYSRGVIGRIYISGGYGGLRPDIPTKTECQEIADYLISKGVSSRRIYQDPRPLDTLGNFAYPLGEPLPGQPNLNDLSILVITERLHMDRALECARSVSPGKTFAHSHCFGDFTPRFGTEVYQTSLMTGLRRFGATNPQEALAFLKTNHPFYQPRWFEKPVWLREAIMSQRVLTWRWGNLTSCRDPYFQMWESGNLD